MNILITGATGMAGSEVVRQAILDPEITEIIALVRRPMEINHPKIRTILHTDFMHYEGLETVFQKADACLWCLGISQLQVSRKEYERITFDYAIAAARSMLVANPDIHFLFLSGDSADRTDKSRVRFARLKGRTENALLQMGFRQLTIARPDAIWPKHKNPRAPLAYKLAFPFFPLVERFTPHKIIGSVQLAKALLYLVKHPGEQHTYENVALRKLGS